MSIDFTPERWSRVRENYRRWWAGELKRPLLHLTLWGRDPGRRPPRAVPVTKCTFYDLSFSPEDIVEGWDHNLSSCLFMGDAFPSVWPDFGPGVAAAYMGAKAEPRADGDTVWFHPAEEKEIADLRLRFDPEARWARRVKDIYRAALQRWQGGCC